MKKEIALIIGALFFILLLYPLTLFYHISSNWMMIATLPVLFIILYSIYHALSLMHNGYRKKAIIFAGLLVVSVILSFQFVLWMIRAMPIVL